MPGYMWVLPCPFKLQRSKLGREAVDYHLHDPWSIQPCLCRALSDFAVVLADSDMVVEILSSARSKGSLTVYVLEDWEYFQCKF